MSIRHIFLVCFKFRPFLVIVHSAFLVMFIERMVFIFALLKEESDF